MFTHYLQSSDSIAIYPVIALVLFFIFFIGAVVWALKADKQYIEAMEQLPLSSSTSAKGPVR